MHARMQVDLGAGRVVPLARLRGTVRPLIFAGSRGYVNKCLRDVERFKADLIERGISRAPLAGGRSKCSPHSLVYFADSVSNRLYKRVHSHSSSNCIGSTRCALT